MVNGIQNFVKPKMFKKHCSELIILSVLLISRLHFLYITKFRFHAALLNSYNLSKLFFSFRNSFGKLFLTFSNEIFQTKLHHILFTSTIDPAAPTCLVLTFFETQLGSNRCSGTELSSYLLNWSFASFLHWEGIFYNFSNGHEQQ